MKNISGNPTNDLAQELRDLYSRIPSIRNVFWWIGACDYQKKTNKLYELLDIEKYRLNVEEFDYLLCKGTKTAERISKRDQVFLQSLQ